MGGEVLKKFGRYFLLDQIAQGGMAEIYRARLASPDGAGRLIVIKRIQTGYGSNNEFLQMFKSEIKVTMGFNHPNIVQLYDFGEEQGQPYISMELVDGRNLRQFMSRFTELKQTFPVELAAYIVEQAASGLHYAHSFHDKITGQALNIVHRDISPQNILISYEGNVKVIDFGIAKAATNSESTRAGVIKGKPSYLSPEQISGETLDGRSDIFALGIVLWEMLAGRKLFSGENDLAVLKLIESCNSHVKPPSVLNPKIPKELDYIVLKSLAKQREQRYQTAEELQRALHKFLYGFMPEFNPSDLSYYAKDLFKNEIVEDRKTIQKLNDKIEQLISSEIPEAPVVDQFTGRQKAEDTTTVVETRPRGGTLSGFIPREISSDEISKSASIEIEATPQLRKTRVESSSRAGSATRSKATPFKTGEVEKRSSVPQSGGLVKKAVLALIAAGVALVFFGPQFGIKIPGLTNHSSQPSVAVERSTASVQEGPAAKFVLLRLNLIPVGGSPEIAINGKTLDVSNPSLQVPLDSPLELDVQRPGYKPFKREFVLDSAQVAGSKEWLMDVPLEPLHFGFLTIHTTPSAEATLLIDGKPWTLQTPVENQKVPVGTYLIRLVNQVLGMEKSVSVTIQEGQLVPLDERLEIKN